MLIYDDAFEELLKSESEKLECYAILHNLCYIKYNRLRLYLYDIPLLILSALIGFLSSLNYPNLGIYLGAVSIFNTLIKSLETYFGLGQRATKHNMTALQYKKISKFIAIQLSLKREDRVKAEDLLNLILNDLDSIRQSEPIISKDIIAQFNEKYKQYEGLTSRPAICNGLSVIKINKPETVEIQIQTEEVPIKDIKKPPFK
jgi:hypothetical protein